MAKKALIIASVASMIDQFNMPNIKLLQELGYEVHVACNFIKAGSITTKRSNKLKRNLESISVTSHQIDFDRNPINLLALIKASRQVKEIMKLKFDIVHSHSPIGGVLGRIASNKYRKDGLKSVYTAHGFHFYRKSPILNWIIFFPIEKVMSYFTDTLITINEEDYQLSKKHLNARENIKIPGVGINLNSINNNQTDILEKKREMGFVDGDFIITSIGELNKNKNHQVVIRALHKLNISKIKYVICGKGELLEYLQNLIIEFKLEDQVKLLGYREDIYSILQVSEVFLFPSFREGLGMASLEAMAFGNALITSDRHGINDYSIEGISGYKCNPNDYNCFAEAIKKIYENDALRERMQIENMHNVKEYDERYTLKIMEKIYKYPEVDNDKKKNINHY